MRILLALSNGLLRPARQAPGSQRAPLDVYLKPIFILAIAVLVGPDLFAFVELATVLELLGAAMFVLAFAAAYKLLAASALDWLRRLLMPADCVWLIEIRGAPSATIAGAMLITKSCVMLATLGFAAYVGIAILAT